MPTTTTNYSWNKPTVGGDEDAWGGYLNGNWDSLDTLLGGVTTVEFGYVSGVTSSIQTQLDAKGTVSSLSDLGVTATSTELNYVDGVTSAIQPQLDAAATTGKAIAMAIVFG